MPISAVFLEPATATKQPASGKNRWAVKRKISRRKLCPCSPFTPTTTVSHTASLDHPTDLETLYRFVTVKNVALPFYILQLLLTYQSNSMVFFGVLLPAKSLVTCTLFIITFFHTVLYCQKLSIPN